MMAGAEVDGVAAATADVVATVIAGPTQVAAVRAAAMRDALPTAAAEMDTAAVVIV
jgi:hypothetical protein